MSRIETRSILRALSIAAFATAVVTALALGPRGVRVWLAVSGGVGVAIAVSSVVAEPRELLVALVFSLAPVASLAADGSPAWMIGPLATLLLVGAELNALSWEAGESASARSMERARLSAVVGLGLAGLTASLLVSRLAEVALFDQTLAVGVGAAAMAGLGWLLFPPRSMEPGSDRPS